MRIWNLFTKKLRRVVTVAGLCAGLVVGVGATAPAASAAGLAYHPMISNLSWLDVGVRGGSTSSGTDIIQWWADNQADQQWLSFNYQGDPGSGIRFQNQGSGLCLTTDGVAGDPVFQQSCDAGNAHQLWLKSVQWLYDGYTLYNPSSGLDLDVSGNSYWGGAEIDAWYPNNQLNQVFSMPGA